MADKLRFYVSIRDGRFKFQGGFPSFIHNKSVEATFAPDETEQAKKFVRKHQITQFVHSSSVNWSEDNGMDEEFDANEWLKKIVLGAWAEA